MPTCLLFSLHSSPHTPLLPLRRLSARQGVCGVVGGRWGGHELSEKQTRPPCQEQRCARWRPRSFSPSFTIPFLSPPRCLQKPQQQQQQHSFFLFFPSLRAWLCGAWLRPTCQIAGLQLKRFLSRPRGGKYGKRRGYYLGSPWHVQPLGSVIPEVRELARQSGRVCQLPHSHTERSARASVEGGTLQSSGGLAGWVWKSGT